MSTNIYKQIGQQVKTLREKMAMSQEELAMQMGYKSAATISHFETGIRKISLVDLQKLSEIFQVEIEFFLRSNVAGLSQEQEQYILRAQEQVTPSWQQSIKDFLLFIRDLMREPVELPTNKNMRPGEAAAAILQLAKVMEPPVDPRLVAQGLNVPVLDWDFPDEVSGLLANFGEKVCIGVNQNHPAVRQRFTVAHELGHLVFHHKSPDVIVDFAHVDILSSSDDETFKLKRDQEMKANWFAADLLMPKSWVEEDFAQTKNAYFLANKYGVSEQALWYRLIALKLVNQSVSPF